MAFDKTYHVNVKLRDESKLYTFVSSGPEEIVKAVEYTYTQHLGKYPVYNLGFGDYDPLTDSIIDRVISNNGDVYTVFYTVLNTVLHFFDENPNAIMSVEGSDSGKAFSEECRKLCRKKCTDICKNMDRRIRTYRWFVDKNIDELNKSYTFYGGWRGKKGIKRTECYRPTGIYNVIYCHKNKIV
ncbi:hypothetical protein [Chitinophaga sp. Cy-1792]|uniref:DUF6934 family protein n=1 Tax=Chitinophaga sp. Cy-1792 TaxID=2608339 RepID=UPI00141E2938|nr:hypothetical protein [Chitinophaga sp. Cy-1792]NIG54817.1 hypothetical protein [Chitinophaga sp. Cy-1792]